MTLIRPPLVLAAMLAVSSCWTQQPVASMITNNSSLTPVIYTSVKGAGLTNSSGSLSSRWDSTATSFTLNFNTGADNITSVTQFSVTGHTFPFITLPANGTVKVRRQANAYVNNAGNYFNFWTLSTLNPAAGGVTGTFDLLGPDITDQENAFLTNNINSGYDNIFQNTISNLHANNIERVDFILPAAIKYTTQEDLDATGAVIFDRGSGDPFKIAAILSLDGSGNPKTFGPTVSVVASQFGPDLRPAAVQFCTFVHDPTYGSLPRPSKNQNQNMRGVFLSLSDLGITVNKNFFGYVLFAPDVTTLKADWTTFPNTTNSGSVLDPINVMGFYREVTTVLASPVIFNVEKQNNKALLSYQLSKDVITSVAIERSSNGQDFVELARIPAGHSGYYSYTDHQILKGTSYYRLKTIKVTGQEEYSEVRSIRTNEGIKIFPIPARDFVIVSLPHNWQQKKIRASLFASSGVSLMNNEIMAIVNEYTISLQGIKPGTYFLQLKNMETGEREIRTVVVKW